MGFIKKLFNFIAHPTHFRTIVILGVLVIVVPLTVIVVQQQQQIKQRAAEPQSVPSSECSPPYDGYLGCLTENGCGNVGISSQVSCSDENVQQGVYCYESTRQGQACSVDATTGVCDDKGNCVISAETIQEAEPTPTVTPTDIPFQAQTPTPILAETPTITIPTSIPTLTITPNIPTSSIAPYCYLKNKGDADCDDKITDADLIFWKNEFLSELSGSATQKQSDFNDDGVINIVDFNIWKTNFQYSSLPH